MFTLLIIGSVLLALCIIACIANVYLAIKDANWSVLNACSTVALVCAVLGGPMFGWGLGLILWTP